VADEFFRNFNQNLGAPADSTIIKPKSSAEDEDATVILTAQPREAHADHDEHPAAPVPRDPDLPDVSSTTLGFFAAGALVVFLVALITLAH